MRLVVVAVGLLAVGAGISLGACDMHFEAHVGDALLPHANAVVPVGDGPTVVVKPGAVPASLPAGPVNLAIDINVPWSDVKGLLARGEASHTQPLFLVGQRQRVRGFVLNDHLDLGPVLKVSARAHGKFCVSPPGTDEAYCLETGDHTHISSVFVRGVMRQAVAEYGIKQARVVPDPDTRWADVVRTVDGVRTCCTHPMPVLVAR
jgi:hypothetical protein